MTEAIQDRVAPYISAQTVERYCVQSYWGAVPACLSQTHIRHGDIYAFAEVDAVVAGVAEDPSHFAVDVSDLSVPEMPGYL